MNISGLLIVSMLGTQPTERGTAAIIRINGRRCLVFPGAVDPEDHSEYYPTARWPDDVTRPFPPGLPAGPSLPGWIITSVCTGPDGDCFAWHTLGEPPIATGAHARCLMACFGPDGRVRDPSAEELAELLPDGPWAGSKRWTPMEVLHAVRSRS